jgi:glycosyltransferase involved in cell wall biosynthesis
VSVPESGAPKSLRILHVLRAPLGGLFRHVTDLAMQQVGRGHEVGLVTDSLTGGPRAVAQLEELRGHLALGIVRMPMHRLPHPGDLAALQRIGRHVRAIRPDVVHGHGAKGGAYARLPGLLPFDTGAVRAYTPHGGSFNYRPGSHAHRFFMAMEWLLAQSTDLLLFESGYIASRFDAYVGAAGPLRRIIVNGVSPAEFMRVRPDPDAADLLYVGELRSAKGIDTLIDALALASATMERGLTLVLVGSGPDQQELQSRAARRGVSTQIRFAGAMPARQAFRLGRVLAVPSRAESLPYVVLEAAAARVPMIATHVGGIPEIFGPDAHRLIPSDDEQALSAAIVAATRADPERLARDADRLADHVGSRFTLTAMTDGVLDGYAEALARKSPSRASSRPHYALSS